MINSENPYHSIKIGTGNVIRNHIVIQEVSDDKLVRRNHAEGLNGIEKQKEIAVLLQTILLT